MSCYVEKKWSKIYISIDVSPKQECLRWRHITGEVAFKGTLGEGPDAIYTITESMLNRTAVLYSEICLVLWPVALAKIVKENMVLSSMLT